MRHQMKLKRNVCFCSLAISLCVTAAFAQGEPQGQPEDYSSGSTETLPSYKGEGSMYLGFRLVNLDGSSKVAEYEEDVSSIALGFDGLGCPLPHRYHLHGEYFGKHNYYGDIGYAYKDFLLFRNIVYADHHNFDHLNYLYPGEPPSIVYEDRSIGGENFVNFVMNDTLLRLKAPDFPLHTFVKHRYVERDGAPEERFLIGSFGNMTKTSETRDINWESKDLTLGVNTHLGPLEVEFSHNLSEFDPDGNNVLHDYFPASFVFGRPADVYPHNVVPETESFANSIKFHSSYTGQIVASATFSNAKYTNNYSGSESEAWKAAMDLRWIPDPVISLFFKYRHREQDKDNPKHVTLTGFANQITYPVRPLISTKKDLFSLSARYRPLSKVTLIGDYTFELRKRKDADEWVILPENSDVHRVNLTAHVQPMDTLKLKAIYDYKNYENPSYNTEPDYSNKVRLNATYTPAAWVTAFIDYSLTLTDRDDLRYLNGDPYLVLTDGERDGRKDRFFGSLSFVFSPEATLTASWVYNRWKVEQDLTYSQWNVSGTGGDLPFYDRGAPYTDRANTLSLSGFCLLRKDLTLTADLSYTVAEGDYQPRVAVQGDQFSLGSFSSMKITETIVSIELAKKILQDWEIGLKLHADFYNDKFSDDFGEHQDGEVYIATFSLKRYF